MSPQREYNREHESQIQRLRSFGDAEVQSQLQLTDEQRQQVFAILRAGFQEAKSIRESLAEVQKRTLEKATAVLTDEQKSQWEQIQGPGMRGPRMGWRAMGDGPGMTGGIRPGRAWSGPGMRAQRSMGPRSPQPVPSRDSQESDVSYEIDEKSLGDFPTNVRVVEVNEFDQASFDELVPLVIKGAAARASKKWTDEWLLQRFGGVDCQVSLDSRTAMMAQKKNMTLAEYLDSLAKSKAADQPLEYLFHSQRDFEGAADLFDEDLDVPAAILRLGNPNLYRFFVGPAYSGTLPHNHTYAINALARGRKRWAISVGADQAETEKLLKESYRNYSSGSQAKDWFVQECPKLRSRKVRLWECAQEAGDLVYIPAFFVHAVVNLEPVVGFTVEFQAREFARRPMRIRGPVRSGNR
jgi:hypothetical protein